MTSWETLDALSHQLELSGIGPGTSVVALLPEAGSLSELVRSALVRSRANVVDVRPIERAAELPTPLVDLLARVDIVIDAMPQPVVYTAPPGVSVLRLLPAAVAAHRFLPHANLTRRVNELAARVRAANVLNLHDRHGSDLQLSLADAEVSSDAGRPVPDAVATYPSGWIQVVPGAHRVSGDLILMPGDANLARGGHLGSPVRVRIDDDRIVAISGDNPDGDTLRSLLEHSGNPDAYGIGAITIGANPAANERHTPFDARLVDPVESRLGAGVITISFGENLVADRPCPTSLTLTLAGRSVTVDDLPVVHDGVLVGDFAPDVYERPG